MTLLLIQNLDFAWGTGAAVAAAVASVRRRIFGLMVGRR